MAGHAMAGGCRRQDPGRGIRSASLVLGMPRHRRPAAASRYHLSSSGVGPREGCEGALAPAGCGHVDPFATAVRRQPWVRPAGRRAPRAEPARANGRFYVDLAGIEHTPVRVAVTPMPSVLGLVGDAVGQRPSGAPEPWRRMVAAALTRRDLAALHPVYDARCQVIPDCALPLPETGSSSAGEALAALAETHPEVLTEQLRAEFGASLPLPWRAVEARPRRWLRAYADALTRAARAAAPIWHEATALIEREVERVGVAVVNGSVRALLATLHPQLRLNGDCLSVPRRSQADEHLHLSPRGLTLVPMVCGTHSRLVARDGSAITGLGYPVPGLDRLLSGDRTTSHGLAALVGPPRSRLLSALDRPAHAGTLADVLEAVPSAVTHHLGVLEAAGLIVRERSGRRVVVRRTARGSALLALYGG